MARSILRIDRKVHSILADIKKTVDEGALTLPVASMRAGMDDLTGHVADPGVMVEVFTLNSGENGLRTGVLKWMGIESLPSDLQADGLKCSVLESSFEKVQSADIGKLKPTLRIILLDPKAIAHAEWQDILRASIAESCFVYLISESRVPALDEIIDQTRDLALYVKSKTVAELEKTSFISLLNDPTFHESLNSVHNYNITLSLESLKNVLRLGIEQERRSMRAKQAMNKQQVLKVQTAGKTMGATDIYGDVKRIMSTHSKALQRGLDDVLDKNTQSKSSAFITELTNIGESIETLQEIKKSKEVIYAIPEDIDQNFLSYVRTYLLKLGQEQLIMMHDAFKGLEGEITQEFEKHNITAPAVNFKYQTDQRLREVIDNVVHWDRPYEGNVAKKGFYEYFMAVRKYQMFVFLIASTFGLSFLKDLRMYMIPLSILILGIGGFLVYNSVRKERLDKQHKERDKARAALLSEGKRIAQDFVRSWQKTLRDHIDAQEQNNLRDLEVYVKSWMQGKKSSEEEEKNQVQRQTQALDNYERKFQTVVRSEEDLSKQIERLKSDLRASFREQIRKVQV